VRNIRVLVEYDGTNYHGFQRQTDNLPTIQKSLEEALGLLVEHPVTVNGDRSSTLLQTAGYPQKGSLLP